MADPQGSSRRIDPGFPIRIVQDLLEDSLPYYRILLVRRGGIRVFSVPVAAEALVFMPPRNPGAQGRRILLEPDAGLVDLSFGRAVLDRVLVPCFANRGLRESMEARFRPPFSSIALAPEASGQVQTFLTNLEKETSFGAAAWESAAVAELVRLFVFLHRLDSADRPKSPARLQVRDMVAHIQEHYADEISLSDLAQKYSLSPGYLSALFRAGVGMPLFEYLNAVRIQKACMLLKRSDEPIIEIAFAVGYNNISFFNRYFRKIMKMSPRQYRLNMSR